jgi:uncharacterized membrane protein
MFQKFSYCEHKVATVYFRDSALQSYLYNVVLFESDEKSYYIRTGHDKSANISKDLYIFPINAVKAINIEGLYKEENHDE